MADREWTKEQQNVIRLRNRDLLVSAAAGSGKTAVLIERILSRITDDKAPIDIDRILVVTFTRAAAREMKERLYKGISERMAKGGDNKALSRQLVLLANAKICTIDSFCIDLIREHFELLGTDPDFRMADEGELKLLSASVWEEILEEEYDKADDRFVFLTDLFSKKGRDDTLIKMLESLYDEAMSYPWPLKWLDEICEAVDTSDTEISDMPWMKAFEKYAYDILEGVRKELDELYDEVRLIIADHPYLDTLHDDMMVIDTYMAATDISDLINVMNTLSFSRLSSKRSTVEDTEYREEWKERRNSLKKEIDDLKDDIAVQPYDTIRLSLNFTKNMTDELVRLLKRYISTFSSKKKSRGIMDFSDAEHLALSLIVNEDGSDGPAAAILRDRFIEVMVDEYQDTNELQEYILKGVSRTKDSGDNYFMVGDIKQSIYRFRQARPEIFAEKYTSYTKEESKRQKIDLSYNFRSKSAVIDTVNDVFLKIMHADLGGVEYDDDAALAQFKPDVSSDEEKTEIYVINKDDPIFAAEHMDDNDAEGICMAGRIRDLVGRLIITDPDTKENRPLRYGDIAILNRGANKIGEKLCETLSGYGIPAHTESTVGYFESIEVQTVLALLSLIVNPQKDIEMATVLRSPIVGLNDEELAMVRASYPDVRFYTAVESWATDHPDDAKVSPFISFTERMRKLSYDTPIHELLSLIYKETGYFDNVRALPKGNERAANLEKLFDMALQYEKTSYKGLASFIGYIEKQKEYEVDYAAAGSKEVLDAVHIMTIHKSKGLEYPLVFISGMGKQFNTMDQRGDVLIHPIYGLGIKTSGYNGRAKLDNLHRKAIVHFIEEDDKGEEQRILYVAMTRAKNKLIMVGSLGQKGFDDLIRSMEKGSKCDTSYRCRIRAKSYMDWILPVFLEKKNVYDITLCDAVHLITEDIKHETAKNDALARIACEKVKAENLGSEWVMRIDEAASYVYPHEVAGRYKNKYSVSDIKHEAILHNMDEAGDTIDEAELPDFLKKEKQRTVPRFLGGQSEIEENVGALRGVAMHRFLECFDFSREDAKDSFDAQLSEEMDRGLLSAEQRGLLRDDKLIKFLESDLANRMMTAAKSGRLHKEHAFVMEHEMEPDVGVLVQGIIDAFFIEDGKAVLLDYKTDRVKTKEELADRYRAQVELYKEAIERAMGVEVKESYLYSFALEEAVAI